MRVVAARDRYQCQRCPERGWDVAHILPKGRYPELRDELKNMVTLCRRCHMETENVEGRRELIALLKRKYGYEYPEKQYAQYQGG